MYSSFVKTHFASVKKTLPPGTPHRRIMDELSSAWKQQKQRMDAVVLDSASDTAYTDTAPQQDMMASIKGSQEGSSLNSPHRSPMRGSELARRDVDNATSSQDDDDEDDVPDALASRLQRLVLVPSGIVAAAATRTIAGDRTDSHGNLVKSDTASRRHMASHIHSPGVVELAADNEAVITDEAALGSSHSASDGGVIISFLDRLALADAA